MIIHLLIIIKFSFSMKGYTICWLCHIFHISLKYLHLNAWRSKWVLQPIIWLKVGIKIYFPRRFKKMAWSLLQFLAFTHLSCSPFVTSGYLIYFGSLKERTATARRKPIKPFSKMLTALWLLCTWKKLSAYFIVLLIVKSGEHSLYRLCQSFLHEGLMTTSWFGPFCKTNLPSARKKAYIYLLISYNAQILSLKWYWNASLWE